MVRSSFQPRILCARMIARVTPTGTWMNTAAPAKTAVLRRADQNAPTANSERQFSGPVSSKSTGPQFDTDVTSTTQSGARKNVVNSARPGRSDPPMPSRIPGVAASNRAVRRRPRAGAARARLARRGPARGRCLPRC